jgi:hypothetical protein
LTAQWFLPSSVFRPTIADLLEVIEALARDSCNPGSILVIQLELEDATVVCRVVRHPQPSAHDHPRHRRAIQNRPHRHVDDADLMLPGYIGQDT